MNKKEKIELREVTRNDFRFLYELLRLRNPKINISHKKIPSYKEHVKFIESKPYSRWYIVYHKNKKIGSAYLTKQNEIGINLKNGFDEEITYDVLMLLIKNNPARRYLANVSPRNKKRIKFLKNHDFKLIQYTYELVTGDIA